MTRLSRMIALRAEERAIVPATNRADVERVRAIRVHAAALEQVLMYAEREGCSAEEADAAISSISADHQRDDRVWNTNATILAACAESSGRRGRDAWTTAAGVRS